MILAIFHLHVNLLLHRKFQFNSPCEKTDFQDGGCGDHLGFLTDTVLAHFDPEVALLLRSKVSLKSTKNLGRDVEN